MTILDPLYGHDRDWPAARIGKTVISYARFCTDIDTMAAWYAGHGLKPGERIAVFARTQQSPNYWDWIMMLGAIRAGLVHSLNALPADIEASAPALAAAVGTPEKLRLGTPDARHLPFQPEDAAPLAEQIEVSGKTPPMKAVDKAIRLFRTSGTTGISKIVAWDAKTMALRLAEVRITSGIGPDTRLFNFLGMITTTGLRHSLGGWQMGCEVLLAAIGDSKPDIVGAANASTHLVASPFNLQKLLEQSGGQLRGSEKRIIELLGGRIPAGLRDAVLAGAGAELRNLYGSTETGMVAYGDARLSERHPGAIGFAVEGAEIEIVDEAGKPVAPGVEGTVRLRTASMCLAYYASEQPLLRDGWFYPGDLGKIEQDGLFIVEGRSGDTINVGGATMAVAPLEEKIRAIPGVYEACVLVIPGVRADLLTVAVSGEKTLDLQGLRPQVTKIVPRVFRVELCKVGHMPRNEMGKIVRRDLAARIARQRMRQRRAKQD